MKTKCKKKMFGPKRSDVTVGCYMAWKICNLLAHLVKLGVPNQGECGGMDMQLDYANHKMKYIWIFNG
jgi:hypothetical protein